MSKKIKVHEKHGVVIVTMYNKNIKGIGKARCNFKKGDKFVRETGIEIATAKATVAFKKAQRDYYAKKALAFQAQAKWFFDLAEKTKTVLDKSTEKLEDVLKKNEK